MSLLGGLEQLLGMKNKQQPQGGKFGGQTEHALPLAQPQQLHHNLEALAPLPLFNQDGTYSYPGVGPRNTPQPPQFSHFLPYPAQQAAQQYEQNPNMLGVDPAQFGYPPDGSGDDQAIRAINEGSRYNTQQFPNRALKGMLRAGGLDI